MRPIEVHCISSTKTHLLSFVFASVDMKPSDSSDDKVVKILLSHLFMCLSSHPILSSIKLIRSRNFMSVPINKETIQRIFMNLITIRLTFSVNFSPKCLDFISKISSNPVKKLDLKSNWKR